MRDRVLIAFLLFTLAFPRGLFAAEETVLFDPNFLLSDDQLTDTSSLSKDDLKALLSMGSLSHATFRDIDGVNRSATDIIWNASQTFSLSPRFLLVLLQREQSLIESNNPTQDQLDWAMGYAVCDDCQKDDPQIQKYRGFANQVYFGAKRIRESYLSDLEDHGSTLSGVGPGLPTTIDQSRVIPVNFATSVLYSYTPHLNGNYNFVRIWNRWFNTIFLDGSLLQDRATEEVFLIQDSLKRPITSHAAFLSRFNPNSVVRVGTDVLDRYPLGLPIQFPNYSLLRSPRGTVYLIVDDKRRGFTSQEAFRAEGFSPDEITDVSWNELNTYSEAEPITTKTVYPEGVLLQDTTSGGVFFVRNGVKQPLLSHEILTANFPRPQITKVNSSNLKSYITADPLPFPDGTLVGVNGSKEIFVISSGVRRPIKDSVTFVTHGWKWNQVVWTNERSVLLHPLGTVVSVDPQEVSLTVTSQP